MTRIKVCGITQPKDAALAAEHGADALGMIFCESPRRVTVEQAAEIRRAAPPFVSLVGVFRNHPIERVLEVAAEVGLSTVQLHGDEPPEVVRALAEKVRVIKAFRVRGPESLRGVDVYEEASGFLLDAYVPGVPGGTGRSFNWELLREKGGGPKRFARPWILAGGLTPENVEEAITTCVPYAVDVSSGVEREPGVKDKGRLIEFIARVRRLDDEQDRVLR